MGIFRKIPSCRKTGAVTIFVVLQTMQHPTDVYEEAEEEKKIFEPFLLLFSKLNLTQRLLFAHSIWQHTTRNETKHTRSVHGLSYTSSSMPRSFIGSKYE